MELTINELESRRLNFYNKMDTISPDWDTVLILGKVNQYYFTGTMQDAVLILKKDRSFAYYVRQSFKRATDESIIKNIYPMKSYRDIAEKEGQELGNVFLETEIIPYAIIERLKKYFNIKTLNPLDTIIRNVRSIKTPYELYWMRQSGKQSYKLLTEIVPTLLKEGQTESEFYALIHQQMMKLGHQGISRYHGYQTELPVGQLGFGTNLLYPSNFDGPSGGLGINPAAPFEGNPQRKLKKGDIVLVDLGFGINGYHTDKTQIYMFGAKPPSEVVKVHKTCMEIEQQVAEKLKPGAIPAQIYNEVIEKLSPEMSKNFMGYKEHKVKFIGHGIGLTVDELPVLANGFDAPLFENMTLAVEPKKGISDFGMIGVEDTFVVTPNGGECITIGPKEIIVV